VLKSTGTINHRTFQYIPGYKGIDRLLTRVLGSAWEELSVHLNGRFRCLARESLGQDHATMRYRNLGDPNMGFSRLGVERGT
jgi:hypothetical protein